ncbi:MAG: glycosyltransferase 61 family protein [Pseudomonadota bacterium]
MTRPTVLGLGFPFDPAFSSCSRRRPRLFDWTDDPAKATVETAVHMGGTIFENMDRPGRKIAWLAKSPAIMQGQDFQGPMLARLDEIVAAYEVVATNNRALCEYHPRIQYNPGASNAPGIPRSRYAVYAKYRSCSMFASDKTMVWGDDYRSRMAAKLKDRLDLFGGAAGSPRIGRGTHPDRLPGLALYRFNVAMENCAIDGYYTEKLTDCFATGTVPVYWGDPGATRMFDPDGILLFDEDFDPLALDEDRYLAMLPAVRRNLELVRQLETADDRLFRKWIAAPTGISVSRLAAPPEPERAIVAWPPIELPPSMPVSAAPEEELLERAQRRDRAAATFDEVPADCTVTVPLETRTAAPRSIRAYPTIDLPMATHAHVLTLRDAFISDCAVHDDDRIYALDRWWCHLPDAPAAAARSVVKHDAVVLLAGWCAGYFQHFLMDVLPQLAAVAELLDRPDFAHVRIVSHRDFHDDDFPDWFWGQLGLLDRVIAAPTGAEADFVIHANTVLAVHFTPNANSLGVYARSLLGSMRGRGPFPASARRKHVLFLKRPHTRRFREEDELLAQLDLAMARRRVPLVVYEPEQGRDVDARMMAEAYVIVGAHGGALANMAFAAPGTHIVEVVPRQELASEQPGNLRMFWGMAQVAGLHYWYVSPDSWAHFADTIDVNHGDLIETVCLAVDESLRRNRA